MPIDNGTKAEIELQLSKIHRSKIKSFNRSIFLENFMLGQARRSATPILIISYEAFRSHCAILHRGTVGLIICDEVSSTHFYRSY